MENKSGFEFNENELEFYVIRRRPHERELVVAVNLTDGGYVYYTFLSGGKPKPNTEELLRSLINPEEKVIIKKIENIEKYIDLNSPEENVHLVDMNNFNNRIICDRLIYSLKKHMAEEAKTEQQRKEYV